MPADVPVTTLCRFGLICRKGVCKIGYTYQYNLRQFVYFLDKTPKSPQFVTKIRYNLLKTGE